MVEVAPTCAARPPDRGLGWQHGRGGGQWGVAGGAWLLVGRGSSRRAKAWYDHPSVQRDLPIVGHGHVRLADDEPVGGVGHGRVRARARARARARVRGSG